MKKMKVRVKDLTVNPGDKIEIKGDFLNSEEKFELVERLLIELSASEGCFKHLDVMEYLAQARRCLKLAGEAYPFPLF